MKKNGSVRYIIQASVIAALYVALTFISSALGLSSGVIQVRFSEALCVLPVFLPAAVPGLFLGCIIANILTGSILIDIVFGSMATLLGAIFTRVLQKHQKLALLPPIISNTLIIPFILKFAYGIQGSILFFMVTIALGEIISCGILGNLLFVGLNKNKHLLNRLSLKP